MKFDVDKLIKQTMNSQLKTNKVIIIGSGCAGWTAAIYAARANLNPLVFTGNQPGGQLTTTSDIENFPGFPEGLAGVQLMSNMQKQAERFGSTVILDEITEVNFSSNPLVIKSYEKEYLTKTVIIATGSAPRMLGLAAEKKYLSKGVSTCATCDGFFFKGKEVAVVGGGDSAMEEAIFLTKFATKVNLIHRREGFKASAIMLERAKKNVKINFILNSIVEDILGNEKVTSIKIKNLKTNEISELMVEGVFIAIGHIPNTKIFAEKLKLDEQGYIIVDNFQQTNIAGVYAAGDVCDYRYRQAITAAAMGAKAAMEVEKYLTRNS